jgi:hypothetical protein
VSGVIYIAGAGILCDGPPPYTVHSKVAGQVGSDHRHWGLSFKGILFILCAINIMKLFILHSSRNRGTFHCLLHSLR